MKSYKNIELNTWYEYTRHSNYFYYYSLDSNNKNNWCVRHYRINDNNQLLDYYCHIFSPETSTFYMVITKVEDQEKINILNNIIDNQAFL